jgi:hypothetical protein
MLSREAGMQIGDFTAAGSVRDPLVFLEKRL